MAKYITEVSYINFDSKDKVKEFLRNMREKKARIVAWDTEFQGFNHFAIMTTYRKPDKKKEDK